jgi:hypothetical protein
MTDWEAYCDELMAGDPMDHGWDEYPIWDWNQYDDVPTVSTRTRVAIVAISVAMWGLLLAGIWVALQP